MRPGRAADHSPPSSAAVMEEWSCNSTHPLGHTGLVTESLYLYFFNVHLTTLHLSVIRGTDVHQFLISPTNEEHALQKFTF